MSFLKGFAVYGFSNALTAALQFAVIFMFANELGPDGFGHFSVFSILYIALSMVIGLGLTAAVQRAYFEIDTNSFKVLVSTVIKAVLLFAIATGFVILLLPKAIEEYVRLSSPWIFYALITSVFQIFIQVIQIILQCQMRTSAYLWLTAFQLSVLLGSSFAFFSMSQIKWEYAVGAYTTSSIATGVISLLFLWCEGYPPRAWSREQLQNALIYSMPLVPHQVAGWVITMVDRLIIANYFGVSQVGIYSFSFQISQSTNVVSNALNQAMIPLLFKKLAASPPEWPEIRRLTIFYGFGLISFSMVFLIIYSVISPYVIKNEYAAVSNYVPWLTLAFFLLSASRIASNYLMYYRKTGQLALATLLSALISIALNFILIPEYGVMAACWSSVASFSFLFVATSWYAFQRRS
jgi:O-antigen/teichoic acid export membrane protein